MFVYYYFLFLRGVLFFLSSPLDFFIVFFFALPINAFWLRIDSKMAFSFPLPALPSKLTCAIPNDVMHRRYGSDFGPAEYSSSLGALKGAAAPYTYGQVMYTEAGYENGGMEDSFDVYHNPFEASNSSTKYPGLSPDMASLLDWTPAILILLITCINLAGVDWLMRFETFLGVM